ncbi:MAG: hypothetical protein ACI92I_000103 [Acidimicrobiales bacterium]|jgi:hypothetical protein
MKHIINPFTYLREAYTAALQSFESEVSRSFAVTATVLIPVFVVLLFSSTLTSAALYVFPAKTVDIQAIQIDVNTVEITLQGNQTLLNAAEVEFYFDPTYVHVYDVRLSESLCEEQFIITKEVDNITGRIFYQCGTVTPFAGQDTTIATLKVIPLKVGTSPLSFGSNTNVLAHDGYGSNVTKDRLASIFQFSD